MLFPWPNRIWNSNLLGKSVAQLVPKQLNFLWVKLFFRPEQFFRGGSLFGEYSWGSGRLSASLLVSLGSFPNQHSFSFSVRYIATLNFRTWQNLKHIFWSEIRNETFFVSYFRFFLPISLRKLKRLAKT